MLNGNKRELAYIVRVSEAKDLEGYDKVQLIMHKNEQYTYEHPKIEYYTDKNVITHEVHSYMADTDDGMILRKKDYYTDEDGVMHSFYYCEHCCKPIENTHRCGDHIYCSMKCANEALSEEMKNFKPKNVREIRMIHL